MGVDIHGLNFLRYTSKKKKLDNVATLARQEIHIPQTILNNLLNLDKNLVHDRYCENLLINYFGAIKVDSYDNSNYEGASHICDFGQEQTFNEQYDTVIDYGVTEHIYNIPNALMNISNLCKINGQILHVLPSNNYCGHGFWQISPELFFSLYSQKNGYNNTEIFVAPKNNTNLWYKVKPATPGERINIWTKMELIILVKTIKTNPHIHHNIQQSDYEYLWNSNKDDTKVTQYTKTLFQKIILRVKHIVTHNILNYQYNLDKNPNLEKINIKQII